MSAFTLSSKLPRALPKSNQRFVDFEGDAQPSVKAATEKRERPNRTIAYSAARLRNLAALLRNGLPDERNEEAARLEARADALEDPVYAPRSTFVVETGSESVALSRKDAAAMLGVSEASLSVMVSRGGGRWSTARRNANGEPETVVISRAIPTKSPKSRSPE